MTVGLEFVEVRTTVASVRAGDFLVVLDGWALPSDDDSADHVAACDPKPDAEDSGVYRLSVTALSAPVPVQDRPLLLGEANPYSDDPAMALYPFPEGSAGYRLPDILGMRRVDYLRQFDRRNLICGAEWNLKAAREAYPGIVRGRDVVVLLGAKVCKAAGVAFEPFSVLLKLDTDRLCARVVLPHPSGLCRLWNDEEARPRARAVVRYAREAVALGLLRTEVRDATDF